MYQFNRKQLAIDIVKNAYRYPFELDIMLKINSNIVSAKDLGGLLDALADTSKLKIKIFVSEDRMEILYIEDLRSSFDTLFKVYGIDCSFYF